MKYANSQGFTLVELMMVVAIMMVLAAIALPLLANTQQRAKVAEVFVNVDGLAKSAYTSAILNATYVTGGPYPRAVSALDKQLVSWSAPPAVWAESGWQPDGAVRCTYGFTIFDDGAHQVNAQAAGDCDVDADGHFIDWRQIQPNGSNSSPGKCGNPTCTRGVGGCSCY